MNRELSGIAALLLGLLALSCAKDSPSSRDVASNAPASPNLLLICIDALRADHLSLYGYERETCPEIAKRFSVATVFDRAFAADTSTTPSVASFLTGLIPTRHGVRYHYQRIPDDLPTVVSVLSEAGYQTAAVVSNMVLTDEACGLASHFDYYDDYVDDLQPYEHNYERRAKPTTDAAIRWLVHERDAASPHFLYVHYMDPHGPYHPPEDKPADFSHPKPLLIYPGRIPDDQTHPGIHDALEYVDLYDEEIAYADREVGRLLDAYEAFGLLDDTVVILTADHGERLLENRHRNYALLDSGLVDESNPELAYRDLFVHGDGVEFELIRVPLAILGGGFEKARIDVPVSLLDLMPTLLVCAGIQVPEGLDGVPLQERPADRILSVEAYTGYDRCVIRGSRIWGIALGGDRRIEARWHCDLDADPAGNPRKGWPEDEAGTSRLMALVKTDPLRLAGTDPASMVTGRKLTAPKRAPSLVNPEATLDEETRELLKKLGYLE